jgi:hypothetical protein
MDSKENYSLLIAADTLVNEDPSIQIAIGNDIIGQEAPVIWLAELPRAIENFDLPGFTLAKDLVLPNELLFADVFSV